MALDRQGQLAGVTGRNGRLYYDAGSGSWNEVQGVSSMAVAPDQAQSQTSSAFEGDLAIVGNPTIGAVTFAVASMMPIHRSWRFLAAARTSGDAVLLNFETAKRTLRGYSAAGETIAVAANSGAATLVGVTQAALAAAGIARGHVIVASNDETDTDDFLVIQQMSGDGLTGMVVSPLAGAAKAVAATRFSIIAPIMRWTVAGQVTSLPVGDATVDAPLTGSLVVQPRNSVGLPVAVGGHRGA